ncbi:MAG: NAD-dependent succinate-semialdehyde dehydrogenase [Spirochaetales bacterium]
MALQSINPYTGTVVAEYTEATEEEVDEQLARSVAAATCWRRSSFDARRGVLERVASVLRERKQEFAELMTLEMGKLIGSAEAEVEKCAWACDYYVEHAERFLSAEPIETDARRSSVAYNPLGVVLAVMPWNFPFWQVMRFAAPAIMAGNAGLLKHASNVQGAAYAIESILAEAGAPDDVFSVLPISGSRVPSVIADPRIAAVTLTGSTPAGRAVGEAAGRALKKCVLELGGSDPYVILEDADLATAADACVTGRMINGGQSCIAAKRLIVVDDVRDQFTELVLERLKGYQPGDPFDPATTLGPMAKADLRDELHDQVVRATDAGAKLRLGGTIPGGPAAFYPATLLTEVGPANPAFREELFGPVAVIVPARDKVHAIELANDSSFGLGAAVFTQDLERGERIATEELDAGNVAVNGFVKSDPRLPFGGIKESGFGRELSWLGIREFVNTKAVVVS